MFTPNGTSHTVRQWFIRQRLHTEKKMREEKIVNVLVSTTDRAARNGISFHLGEQKLDLFICDHASFASLRNNNMIPCTNLIYVGGVGHCGRGGK